MATEPVQLELRGITKAYPAVVANDDISLQIKPGSLHALLGENGAGKSTLMKIIYGVVKADHGEIIWDGKTVDIASPAQARALGIGMVFQHFSLFPALSVLENLILSLPAGTSRSEIAKQAVALAEEYGLTIEPDRVVHSLSVGERQRVEILRCLLQKPKLLILDEPTSVLTPQAVTALLDLLRTLAKSGCSIVYISHKLHEVCDLCDTATVLRQGKVVATVDPRRQSQSSLARMMIGDIGLSPQTKPPGNPGKTRLKINGLNRPSEDDFSIALKNINLSVSSGEIFGIGGIAGNGQAEFLEAISGEWPAAAGNVMEIDGRPAGLLKPAERRTLGLAYVPEERLGHGAVPQLALSKNTLLTGGKREFAANGLINFDAIKTFTRKCIKEFDVRAATPSTAAQTLSGGNLQKFIMGREISHEPGIVVAAQPTWGLDVGAASAIRATLIDMSARGAAILIISEDLDELFEICDRIAIMSAGQLSPIRAVGETSVEEVGRWMAGHLPEPAAQQAGAG